MKKSLIFLGLLGGFALVACNEQIVSSSSSGGGAGSTTSSSTGIDYSKNPLANGVYDWTEKPADMSQSDWVDYQSNLLYKMEDYAMRHHLAGIPLYDDASLELFSPRITLASDTYIENYGFGINESKLNPNGNMYNKQPISGATFPNYFQGYTTTDSGTFNYWNSSGEDVGGRNGMISNSYFGVTMNATKDGYVWRNVLAKDARPIPLDDSGNEVEYTEGTTYRKWRVRLHTGEDGAQYSYAIAPTSKYYAKYNGRPIELEDYLTPFRAILDNNLFRASGLTTDASGFAGANDYVYAPDHDSETWANVGIQLNEEEGSIDFEFVTPQTQFYAMYNLSSSLYSPLPKDYLIELGGGDPDTLTEDSANWSTIWKNGCRQFGAIGSAQGGDYTTTVDNLLSTGPYIVTSWQKDVVTVYEKNPNYSLASEINFQGYVETKVQNDEDAYQRFISGKLDNVTCPSEHTKDHANDPQGHRAEGSTILKINLNTCSYDEWDYFFGPDGTQYPHANNLAWDVKWIMSNDNFLDGMFFAIDRAKIASTMGRNPAVGYLSDAYKIDPENNISYRDTEAGKKAVSRYTAVNPNGYSTSMAAQLFRSAVATGVGTGELERNTEIMIDFTWRYQTSIDNVGNEIKNQIETVFNSACKEWGITLNINNHAVSDYTQAYNAMDRGEFDLAEGAITGNVLNPLEFMSVICTNNLSQGFTCSWGEPTEHVSETYPILFDGDGDGVEERFSYDAFYTACNGSAVVQNGINVPLAGVPENMDERAEIDGASTVFILTVPDSLIRQDGSPAIQFKFNYVWLLTATADNTAIGPSYFPFAATSSEAEQYCSFNENTLRIEIRIPTSTLKNYYTQLLAINGSNYSNLNLYVGIEAIFDSGVHRTVMVTDLYVTPEVAGIA